MECILYRQDAGLNGTQEWFSYDYDDSDWEEVDLFDKTWGSDGLNPVNGSHWLRKEFSVPAHSQGKPAVLRLGCIVDADSVFVNGVFVGTTAYQYPPRIYTIPANLLKEGKNTITVRLVSYSGYPGFVEDKPYKLVFDNEEISLEGTWKYRQGTRMPHYRVKRFSITSPQGCTMR
jgi:sialate O-acetylesterase